jgi:hypothetical protein
MLRASIFRRPALILLLSTCFGAPLTGENAWPVWVAETDAAGKARSWQAAGPLLFINPTPEGGTYRGLRPFYLRREAPTGELKESFFLYPLYIRRQSETHRSWSIFNLINHTTPVATAGDADGPRSFDIWPFYFSRDTGSPGSSYRALFPLAGTVKHRFGYDRLTWGVFPLFWQSVKAEVITTSTPWPIIKRSTGGGHRGFAVWPLFGHNEKPEHYRQQYYLWPLIYKNESRLSEPVPTVKQGFLPFYTRDQSADAVSENFVWPFFGYTHRTEPSHYREVRYFWPLLVQGRGDDQMTNRWAPFYSRSLRKGVEKTWIGWPLLKEEQWAEADVMRTRHQFLFFLYWSEEQRSLINPDLPTAEKAHVWPLLSTWDNGAGRRQAQFPSPLEVFFPHNDTVRQLYNPLFALYRYDQRSPEDVRTALLWNAISWHRHPAGRKFHLGPLFSSESNDAGRRVAFGRGLLGFRQLPGSRSWRMFLFDFPPRPRQPENISQPEA